MVAHVCAICMRNIDMFTIAIVNKRIMIATAIYCKTTVSGYFSSLFCFSTILAAIKFNVKNNYQKYQNCILLVSSISTSNCNGTQNSTFFKSFLCDIFFSLKNENVIISQLPCRGLTIEARRSIPPASLRFMMYLDMSWS